MQSRFFVGVIGALVLALVSTATEARADATCSAPVTAYANQLAGGGWYTFEMTIHRTDIGLVTYSRGTIERNASVYWPMRGWSNQLFNDRYAGSQPFNINAADQLQIWINPTGQLYIYYSPWNFSTSWDMSCSGNTFTKIIPGYGVVTLTFRSYQFIG